MLEKTRQDYFSKIERGWKLRCRPASAYLSVLHPTRLPLLRTDESVPRGQEIAFEERDISTDLEARREMTEQHDSDETPTLVIFSGETTRSDCRL